MIRFIAFFFLILFIYLIYVFIKLRVTARKNYNHFKNHFDANDDTTIVNGKRKKNIVNPNAAEYTDFEEIKDNENK